jgi:hypothetical protein
MRAANAIESTFATVRHRTTPTRNRVSRPTFLGLAFKLIAEIEKTWRRINGPEQIKLLLESIALEDSESVQGDQTVQQKLAARSLERYQAAHMPLLTLAPVRHRRWHSRNLFIFSLSQWLPEDGQHIFVCALLLVLPCHFILIQYFMTLCVPDITSQIRDLARLIALRRWVFVRIRMQQRDGFRRRMPVQHRICR